MQTVKVEKLDDIDIAVKVLRSHFEEHGGTLMAAKKLDESLTDRQRGLYWMWIKPMADHTGYMPVELHEHYKENMWLNLYLADPENHAELCNAVEAMKSIRKEVSPAQYQEIRKYIMTHVSHLDATKQNMKDALMQVEIDAGEMNVALPQPPSSGLVGKESKFYRKK